MSAWGITWLRRPGDVASLALFLDRVREPLAVFAVTRVALFVLVYVSMVLLPMDGGSRSGHSFFLDAWLRWDAEWYLKIVREGYSLDPQSFHSSVAFFPLYPWLVRAVSFLTGNPVLAGVLVSNVSFAAALCLLYDLTATRFDRNVAWRTVLLVSVFPFGLFFSAIYTESLFLLTTMFAFWLADRGNWWLAGVAGMFCSLSRLVGIVMLPVLLLLYLRERQFDLRRVGLDALAPALVPLGLASFMAFLFIRFGDPLAFYHAGTLGWDRYNVFRDGFHRINPLDLPINPYDFMLVLNFYTAMIWLFAVVFVWRSLGPAYAIFVFLGVAIPLSSGVESLGRYVSVLFPVFIVAARWLRNELAFNLVVASSTLMLALLAALFAARYWVV